MKEIEYKQSIASQDSVIASQKAELAKMLEDIQRLSDKVTEEPVMSPLILRNLHPRLVICIEQVRKRLQPSRRTKPQT